MIKPRVLLCYKNFSKDCNVSHAGLGITGIYSAKTLMAHGIRAQALPTYGADDLEKFLHSQVHTSHPVTHVLVMAQWIPTERLAKLTRVFPHIKFGLKCHSNVGFLQAEPNAIKLLREAIDLETGTTNFFACANNERLCNILKDMYGRPVQYLPNLYYLHGQEPIHRPVYNGGPLRIGAFGSLRVYKNFSTAVTAGIEIGHMLRVPVEIWINSGRNDGAGNIVYRTARAWTDGVPGVQLKELPWCSWPDFKRHIGTMNLLLQPSYTETFNNVTADGIAEGVPSVVSDTIEWVPENWKASTDDPKDVASVGRRLLADYHAPAEGYQALKQYVTDGLVHWRKYLDRP